MIRLDDIYVTERRLRHPSRVLEWVDRKEIFKTPILLRKCNEGYYILDGHHRAVAYVLMNYKTLYPGQYSIRTDSHGYKNTIVGKLTDPTMVKKLLR